MTIHRIMKYMHDYKKSIGRKLVSKKELEKRISHKVKKNPKEFFKYVRSKKISK